VGCRHLVLPVGSSRAPPHRRTLYGRRYLRPDAKEVAMTGRSSLVLPLMTLLLMAGLYLWVFFRLA